MRNRVGYSPTIKWMCETCSRRGPEFIWTQDLAPGSPERYLETRAGAAGFRITFFDQMASLKIVHDDVMKWKHFPRYWPFVRGIHRGPTQRPVTRSFDVFFDLRLNKRLSKQSWGLWLETPSRPSWRHCNEMSLHLATTTTKLRVFSEKVLGCSWFRSNHLCWPFGVIHNGWRNLTKSRLESLRCCAQPTPSWWLQMSWRQIGRKPSETTKLTLLLRLMGILIHINHITQHGYRIRSIKQCENITVTSLWARWRLKSPASRMFT